VVNSRSRSPFTVRRSLFAVRLASNSNPFAVRRHHQT
jgi:hypothetical protein